MIRCLIYLILCAVGEVDLSEVVGIQTTCIDGGWNELYQQKAPVTWSSIVIHDCSVDSCSFQTSSDYIDLDNLQNYEDDGYAFLILWDNTYYIHWKQALNPLSVAADSATVPLSGEYVSIGISENLDEWSDLDFSGLSISPDSGVLLDGHSADGAWFGIAVTVDIELTDGDTSVGIPAWKVRGSDGRFYFAQQVNFYVWNASCGEWGIPSESPTEQPTILPSRSPTHNPTDLWIFNGSTGGNGISLIHILIGFVIGGFVLIICFLLICWRHMERVRRKEMKRTLEEVNEKLAEEFFPELNAWYHGNLLTGSPYQNAPYNVGVLNQIPGSYNAPINIAQNPYVINQYTNPRSAYNTVTSYDPAMQYNQVVPYIPGDPYTGNAVSIIDPAHLRAESRIISSLRVRKAQNMEDSVSFPLQSTAVAQSASHRGRGSPRRKEFIMEGHSNVPGYNSVDRVAGQRFASEEEESSSTSETPRELNEGNVKLKTRQLEESDSSCSSSSESVEKSSDASLVSRKLQTKRHIIARPNEAMDMGEFEGLCEQFGILQDMGIEGVSNRPI